MNSNYTSIFLIGFRASGKTSLGKALAKKISWDFIDMDDLIQQKAGETIDELTYRGTTWKEFRKLERETLKGLLMQKNIIIGCGGGTAVNDVMDEESNRTYGQLNTELLISSPQTLLILLTADEDIILKRIREQEMKKTEVKRPILDEKRAEEIQKKLEQFRGDKQKRREIIIDEIIKDSPEMMHLRKPLYEALTSNIIDTGKLSIEESVEKIIQFLK